MLIDLLSQSNYNQYNISLAKVIGLHPAIYVNVLLSINSKAILKQKLTDEEYFSVDRNYIESVTTFSIEEQKSIEKLLLELNILKKLDKEELDNIFFLDVSTLTSIMISKNEHLLSDIEKLAKSKTKKKTKTEVIKEELKKYIVATNQELKDAYYDWIDAVFAKQGWMSKRSVISGQQVVDDFSHRDLDVALKLIEIASIGGYRDMTWAVNSYKDNYKVQYHIPQPRTSESSIGVSSEIF